MSQSGKIEINKFFFYVGFALLIVHKFGANIEVLQGTLFNTYWIYFIGVFFIILSTLKSGISLIEILLIAYGVGSFFMIQDLTLLTFLSLIIAAKNIVLEDTILFYYRIQFVFLGICIILYPLLKVMGSSLATASFMTGRFRYNFFFKHPNNFAAQCVFTVLAYIYINRNTFSIKKINIIVVIAALFLWIFPNSYTATFVLLIYAFLNMVVSYFRLLWKPAIRIFIPIFMLTVIYILYLFYSGNTSFISNYITGTFASRFIGATHGLKLYNINLFGNYISDIGELIYINGEWGTLWLDLAYVRMLITFGIVGAGIFYILFIRSFYIYIKERDYNILILFITVLAYALSEWVAFSASTVFPLLFCSISISRKNRLIKTKYLRLNFN